MVDGRKPERPPNVGDGHVQGTDGVLGRSFSSLHNSELDCSILEIHLNIEHRTRNDEY